MENENFKHAWRVDSNHFVYQDEKGLHWVGFIKNPWGEKRKGCYKMTGQIGIVKDTLILFPWKHAEFISFSSFLKQNKEIRRFPLWNKTQCWIKAEKILTFSLIEFQ